MKPIVQLAAIVVVLVTTAVVVTALAHELVPLVVLIVLALAGRVVFFLTRRDRW